MIGPTAFWSQRSSKALVNRRLRPLRRPTNRVTRCRARAGQSCPRRWRGGMPLPTLALEAETPARRNERPQRRLAALAAEASPP
jgi:hypothetical protein